MANPFVRYAGDLKKFEWEGEHLIPMAMWFTSKGTKSNRVLAFYHIMIVVSLISRSACFTFILLDIEKVDCKVYKYVEWSIFWGKTIAIAFITLKTLGNVPRLLMLRYSAEYKNSGP